MIRGEVYWADLAPGLRFRATRTPPGRGRLARRLQRRANLADRRHRPAHDIPSAGPPRAARRCLCPPGTAGLARGSWPCSHQVTSLDSRASGSASVPCRRTRHLAAIELGLRARARSRIASMVTLGSSPSHGRPEGPMTDRTDDSLQLQPGPTRRAFLGAGALTARARGADRQARRGPDPEARRHAGRRGGRQPARPRPPEVGGRP